MPRIRSIKPDFFKSRAVRKLSASEKLVWIGLWCYADDSGRALDEPGMLVGDLWALNLSAEEMEEALQGLAVKGRISRYTVDDEAFIQVNGWDHQKISHPSPSEIPPEPLRRDSGDSPDPLRPEGKGEERKGGEAPPAEFCQSHPGGTPDPCRACGDARRAFAAWQAVQKAKPTATPKRRDPSACSHRRTPDGEFCLDCDARLPPLEAVAS